MSKSASPDNSNHLSEHNTKPLRSSVFKKPVVLLWLTAAIVAGVMIWYTGISNENLERAGIRHQQTIEFAGTIVHLDEVLTMSANMAATTGDMQWEDRYRRAETKLDAAIKKLIEISSVIESADGLANTINTANLELVEMENEAFELTRKGNNQAAMALLRSGEYEKHKTIYIQAMQQLSLAAKEHIESKIKTNRFIAMASMLLTGALISLTLFAWLAVVKFLRGKGQQTTTDLQLNQSSRQLITAEQQIIALKQQVAEGNEELYISNSKIEQLDKELESSTERANLMAREAVNANEAKGRFLANLSHEIRTPMNAIVGFSDVLAEEKLNEHQQDYVNLIRESSRHLLQLINSMLDFSEIEAGKIRTEMADCSLAKSSRKNNNRRKPTEAMPDQSHWKCHQVHEYRLGQNESETA
jgi:K+-sensing histidine kinase KdpD